MKRTESESFDPAPKEKEPASPVFIKKGVQPYRSPIEHLFDLLKRVDLLIQREIVVFRRGRTANGEWDRLAAITDDEVATLLRSEKTEEISAEEIDLLERLARLDGEIKERVSATTAAGNPLPLPALSRIFRLSPLETELLVIALAPELDRRYERLFGYLHDDMTRKLPSVGLALSLCCPAPVDRVSARAVFSPYAPLIRYRLLRVIDDPAAGGPLLSRPVRIDDPIVSFLLGDRRLDPRLREEAEWVSISDPSSSNASTRPDLSARLIRSIEGCFGEKGFLRKPAFYLHGPAGTGKKGLALSICRHFGLPLLVVDAERLAASPAGFEEGLFLSFREGLLHGGAVYIDCFDRSLGPERSRFHLQTISKQIEEMGGITFFAGERPWSWPGLLDSHFFLPVELRLPGDAAQIERWRERLADCADADDRTLALLASKYRFSEGEMEEIIQRARRAAALRGDGPVTMADIDQGCRDQKRPNLGPLARKIEPKYGWSDMVLPPEPMNQLREICNQARHRSTVFGRWGFERKLSLGKGLNVLFSGPPGTGKTMAAEVLSHELKLDLFKIDLSQVVSKYIGETEKSLHQIFREAEANHAILFFDEADALLGKRSEVKDAHDRYANIEIGYLLQKMEEYEGVTILATNLRQNIDDAFVRRIRFIIEFPFPEEEDRLRIWQGIWPKETPLAEGIDLGAIARRFKLAGGNIRNIAVAASFLAAAEGKRVEMGHLLHATRRELYKMGRLVSDGEFDIHLEHPQQ